jgi:hypothetical protein
VTEWGRRRAGKEAEKRGCRHTRSGSRRWQVVGLLLTLLNCAPGTILIGFLTRPFVSTGLETYNEVLDAKAGYGVAYSFASLMRRGCSRRLSWTRQGVA